MSFFRRVVGVVLAAVLLAAVPLAASGAASERAAAPQAQASLASQTLQGLRALLAHFLPTAGPVGTAERLHGVPQPHLTVSCDNTSGMDPNGCPKP